jgi:hypothetical protein
LDTASNIVAKSATTGTTTNNSISVKARLDLRFIVQ